MNTKEKTFTRKTGNSEKYFEGKQ